MSRISFQKLLSALLNTWGDKSTILESSLRKTLIQACFFGYFWAEIQLTTPETFHNVSTFDSVRAPLQSEDWMACLPTMVNA